MSELIEEDVVGGCTRGKSETKPGGIHPLMKDLYSYATQPLKAARD
jgi:hypothetical protein